MELICCRMDYIVLKHSLVNRYIHNNNIAFYHTPTQVYLEGNFKTLEDLKHDKQFSTDSVDEIRNLCHRYDARFVHSWVVKLDPISFEIENPYALGSCKMIYKSLFKHLIDKLHNVNSQELELNWENNCDFLGIVESSSTAIHLHLTFYSQIPMQTKNLSAITNALTIRQYKMKCECCNVNTKCDDKIHDDKLRNWEVNNDMERFITINAVVTYDKIKSPSGYLNYLKKDPKMIMSNKKDLLKYYINFRKEIIFGTKNIPKHTQPKKTIFSSNPVVLLFFKLFEQGIWQYQDVMQCENIQQFLNMPQLKNIYYNCLDQYISSHDHVQFLIDICKKYIELEDKYKCMCPVIDWFNYQNMHYLDVMRDLTEWCNGIHKKNAILLIGPADSGKSHIARKIWELFPFHTRIVQDGIFSFSNLVNSGCGLWDEPFIAPELVDTAKLVLEGEESVQIVIKNQSSKTLGKRVPIIITTNSELHKYCSGERTPLAQRCYRWECTNTISEDTFCSSTTHTCAFIGQTNSAINPFANTSSEENQRRGETSSSVCDCKGIHRVESNHMLTFVVQSLCQCIDFLKPFHKTDLSKQIELYDLIRSVKGTTCFMSSFLEEWAN